MKCRHCHAPLTQRFVDLGSAPPSNAYLSEPDLRKPETHYPLRVLVCGECHLVQTEDYVTEDAVFGADYAYFSSTSRGWLLHATAYCDLVTARFGLGPESFVIEVASNDGYLLRNFVERGIPCLGIEPTASTAAAAEAVGVPTLRAFFGAALAARLAKEDRQADLIVGNNVFAHVPDINDFTVGLARALKPDGVITLEFPHLMRLVECSQFDTIYHEHFSYLSLMVVARILAKAGLRIFDVEELPTHGGSLRVYGCHLEARHTETPAVNAILTEETRRGMATLAYYDGFQAKAEAVKNGLVAFLLAAKREGRSVAGYGAAAKGNTLLNYAGIRPDLLPFICDAAAAKIGKFMPGSHIPILDPAVLESRRPDYLIILPWNIAQEVRSQNAQLAAKGTRFVVTVPELTIL
jgi:SAM-dependent methyltransferase